MIAMATARFRNERKVGEMYTTLPATSGAGGSSAGSRRILSSVLSDFTQEASAYRTSREQVNELAFALRR